MGFGLFIAGTDTGVGKTRVTVGLIRALRARGLDAIGMKPVAAGVGPDGENEDVARLRAAAPVPAGDQNPYCFERPVSPHLEARRTGVRVEPQRIVAAYRRLAGAHDAVLVEGAGGWFAPIGEQATMADIATALAVPVLLVVGLRLGCLSHALLTRAAVQSAGLPLAGWVGSIIDPQMAALEDNLATLRARLPAPAAVLPYAPEAGGDAAWLAPLAAALATASSL